MKTYNIFLLISISLLIVAILACDSDTNRRIKLASKPSSVLMQEKVSTIQIQASNKKSIAIYHFINNTKKQDLNWLEPGIVEMLTSELAQSRQLNIIPGINISEEMQKLQIQNYAVQDSVIGYKLARNVGAQVFICGHFDYQADSLCIDLELRDAENGKLLQKITEKGGGLENVFSMINNMSRSLRENLQINLSNLKEVDPNKGRFATNSLEAFKYYSLGMKFQNQLYVDKAFEQFKKAIETDSTFASAYLRLSVYYYNNGNIDLGKDMIEKAARYSQYAPPRERLHILGTKALADGEIYEAIEYYENLVDQFPEDAEAHYQLGNFYQFQNGRSKDAIEHFEATIALNPEYKLAYNNLGYAFADLGKIDFAYWALQKYIELAKDEPNPYDSYGEILLIQGEIDKAIEQFKISLSKDKDFQPASLHIAEALLDKGKTKRARKIARQLIEQQTGDHINNAPYYLLANSYIVENRFKEVKKIIFDLLQEMPDNIGLLFALLKIDPENTDNLRLIKDVINNYLEFESLENLDPNTVLPVTALAFQADKYYYQVNRLLDMLLEKSKDPIVIQTVIAFKQILFYYDKIEKFDVPEKSTMNNYESAFKQMTNITWQNFWKYYFTSIDKAIVNNKLDIKDILNINLLSKKTKNLHFEINTSFALAIIYNYQNNTELSHSFALKTGAPRESSCKYFGPFNVDRGFHQQFWPEEHALEDLYIDVDHKSSNIADKQLIYDGYIDLGKICDAKFNQAVYTVLPVWVPSARTAELRLGPSGPVKVWLNNRKIITRNLNQQAILDRVITKINLNSGQNYLMVKTNNRINELGFYLRITDDYGYGYPDLEFTEKKDTMVFTNN